MKRDVTLEQKPNLQLCLDILKETFPVEMRLREVVSRLSADDQFISIIAMEKIIKGIHQRKKNDNKTLNINSLDFGDLVNIFDMNFYDIRSADLFSKMERDLEHLDSYKDSISRLQREQTVWDVIKQFVIEKSSNEFVEFSMFKKQLDKVYEFRNEAAHFRIIDESSLDKVKSSAKFVLSKIILKTKTNNEDENFVGLHESLQNYRDTLYSAMQQIQAFNIATQPSMAGLIDQIKDINKVTQPSMAGLIDQIKDINKVTQPSMVGTMQQIKSLYKFNQPGMADFMEQIKDMNKFSQPNIAATIKQIQSFNTAMQPVHELNKSLHTEIEDKLKNDFNA